MFLTGVWKHGILQTFAVFARIAALLTCKGLLSSLFELVLLEILKLIAGIVKLVTPERLLSKMYVHVRFEFTSFCVWVIEYSHCVQAKGFSPEWISIRILRPPAVTVYTGVFTLSATESLFLESVRPHMCLEVTSCSLGVVTKGATGRPEALVSMWFLRWPAAVRVLLHCGHLKGFPPEWACMCILRAPDVVQE